MLPPPGDFSWVQCPDWREVMERSYAALDASDWEALRTRVDGPFMFSSDKTTSALMDKLGGAYAGHSGASLACAARNVECIAQHGWDAYLARTSAKHYAFVHKRAARVIGAAILNALTNPAHSLCVQRLMREHASLI